MAGRVYDYGRFRNTGKRLIDKFGTEAQLRRVGEGPWDCTVVFAEYRNSQVDGTRILLGDFMGYVPALGLDTEPRRGDYLFWGLAEREVIGVTAVKPGSAAIVYTLQLRGPR